MVTITLHCPHCQCDALVRNGRVPNGKQKYLCPESPSALVFPRLFLPLVLSMSASLEEARIG